MKKALTVFVIACLYYSCHKTGNNPPSAATNCKIARMVQGVNNDTVFLLNYNANGRLVAVKDSTYDFTATAAYDANGKMIAITTGYIDDTFSIKYNSSGLISRIRVVGFFNTDEYVYDYNSNNMPV